MLRTPRENSVVSKEMTMQEFNESMRSSLRGGTRGRRLINTDAEIAYVSFVQGVYDDCILVKMIIITSTSQRYKLDNSGNYREYLS